VSDADAVGLVQVRTPAFADMVQRHPRLFTRGDRRDPYENLLAGGLYLAHCARVLGADLTEVADISTALNAYNAGPSAIQRLRVSDPSATQVPQETRLHAARVLASYAAAKPSTTTSLAAPSLVPMH
jgi:soluble lytic murein transglycosylase-like protein